jgi:alkanesulfonate monooxygenase SsuD/methylene tetrahydromethanopterin reductase-like flavin-dependent oxidoreductase (luciferase family)
MRSALWLPLFDELADPAVVVRLAVEADNAGWDGLFVWDHLHWHAAREVADPWITLAAAAAVTERLLLGPHGHATRAEAPGQGRAGDRDTGPAQRRAAGASGWPGSG